MRSLLKAAAVVMILAAITASFSRPLLTRAASNEDFVIEDGILRSYKGSSADVVIPRSASMIGPGAFAGTKVNTVTIPSSVKTIGTQAFYNCRKLERVTIDEGTETIGMSAFADCPKLYLINIPASVNNIQPGIFAGDTSLSEISLSRDNKDYFFNDGVLYNRDSTELVQYLAGRKATFFQIPFTVKKIDRYAFWGATLLTKVRISNNVPEIPDHAFSNCIGLTVIYLPDSVRRIGAYGFSDCVNLYYVAMERDDVRIAKTAFAGCSGSLATENGISESEASKKKPVVSENRAVSGNDTKDEGSGSKKKKKKESSSSALSGEVKRVKGSYSALVSPDKPTSLGSRQGIWGQSRVSGGKALVIPEKKK